MADQQTAAGTVLRGADGSIYFIRKEVLEACRQPPEMAEQLEKLLAEENEVQGFSIDTSRELSAMGNVEGPVGVPPGMTYSTVMCPSLWSVR